ncbi:MAG: hypothetical protein EA379_04820 [Phycisphaerales bacterium]|nr:MAG: hypothetical protein EA379_04820 [Phycisphaerales bacterium]
MANPNTSINRGRHGVFCALLCAFVALSAQGSTQSQAPVANPLGTESVNAAERPIDPRPASAVEAFGPQPAPLPATSPTPADAPAPTPAPEQEGATQSAISVEAHDADADAVSTEALPLGAPRARISARASGAERSGSIFDHWLLRTAGALAVVIGLVLLLRTAMRRVALGSGSVAGQLGAGGRAPSGVLTVLARYPVARGQTLVLLRMDRRVLLLNQTAAGFATLAEVTDPEEVASLLIKTRDDEGDSMAQRFGVLLRRMERDPSIAGDDGVVDVRSRRFAEAPPPETAAWPEARDPVGSIRRRLASLREGA